MGASVALLACVFVGFFLVAPAKPDLIAMLQAKDASLTYQAAFQDGQLEVERVTGEAAPFGLVHQLWVIEPGGVPISLGLLETANLRLAYPVPPNGSVIAISVEPAGGSPTGAPTGPVILSAQIEI
jgi:anti-sigma-K factor RskA